MCDRPIIQVGILVLLSSVAACSEPGGSGSTSDAGPTSGSGPPGSMSDTGSLGGSGVVDGTRGGSSTGGHGGSTAAATTAVTTEGDPTNEDGPGILFDAGVADFSPVVFCTEGTGVCDPRTEFCYVHQEGPPDAPLPDPTCVRLPVRCLADPTCECLLFEPGDRNCEVMEDGVLLVYGP